MPQKHILIFYFCIPYNLIQYNIPPDHIELRAQLISKIAQMIINKFPILHQTITNVFFDTLRSTEGTYTGKVKMAVLTQTALKRLLIHISLNMKTLADSESSSTGRNSSQNSPNSLNLSQQNYIRELQKEKVFSSLGILILNFSQVLSSTKNMKEKRNKWRSRRFQNMSRNDDKDGNYDGDGETEEGTVEGKGENEDEDEVDGEQEEGEGGVDDENGEEPCDLLPTVDLIIAILTHVVTLEVRYRLSLTLTFQLSSSYLI